MGSDNQNFSVANLSWEGDIPASDIYDDVYFSLVNGLDESQYVFLNANDLPARFHIDYESASNRLYSPFIIAEAGFGSGLNFLLSWKNWRSIEVDKRRPLHFISFEKHPLSPSDLFKSLSKWPSLDDLAKQLVESYPLTIEGHHRLTFESSAITLTLIFGDMLKATPDYTFKADCWYLDGFSPNRNPEMWSPDLFREVARLSAEEATFSTFAAASFVRKGLEAAGFEVKKRKGFGKKREMLFGNISKQSLSDTNKRSVQSDSLNWSRSIPSEVRNGEPSTPSHEFDVLVVGAGLAGITTATALAKQGKHVALLDEKEDAVMGASGQSQLVMYAKFPSERNKLFNFVEHCLANSLQHYKSLQLENMSLRHVNQSLQLENKSLQHANESLQLENEFWHPCGVLQLAWNDKEANKQARFNQNIQLPSDFIRSIDKDEAFKKSGIQTQCGGLWFESAGWLDPNNYAKFLLNRGSQYKGAIKRYFGERVLSLSSNEDYSWTAETKHRSFQAKSLVICNSNDAKRFSQLEHLPIKPLRGQVTSIKARNTEQNIKSTQCVLTGEGYLCPAVDDWHHFGATFDLDSTDTSCKQTDNKQNLTNIQQWNPNWLTPHKQDQLNIDDFIVESNAGLRCTTPDYIPIVGQAPIYSDMLETFAKLRVGANSCKHLYGHYYEGLYVNIGHGSKGAFTTPVAADIISQMICGGAPPVNETIRSMLSPARFIIKHLKQRRI